MSEFAKDLLTLEETNKLRTSLGLKPLTNDAAPESSPPQHGQQTEGRHQTAEDNYRNYTQQEAKRKEEEEIRDRITRAQNKRELRRQLRGSTLGEANPTDAAVSAGSSGSKATLKWLRQAQKKAKEHAAKRAKEIEEEEAAASARATEGYGEDDLVGMRVAHDVDEFDLQAGEEGRILTLKDSKILDAHEDELMDSVLAQKDFDKKNEERKRGPKRYTGLEDEEDMQSIRLGSKKGVLSKYDSDISGGGGEMRDADAGFRLGGSAEITAEKRAKRQQQIEEEARLKNRTLLSLDYSKNQEVSDYLAPGDAGFKKFKSKKKRAPASKIKLDEDENDNEDEVQHFTTSRTDAEMAPIVHARRIAEDRDNLVDDEELAASLSKTRRANAKLAMRKITPEEIAKNLAAQKAAEEAEQAGANASTHVTLLNGERASVGAETLGNSLGSGLTFDETSEFIRTIGSRTSEEGEASERRQRLKQKSASMISVKSEPRGTPLLAKGIDVDASLNGSETPSIKDEGEEDELMTSGEAGFSTSSIKLGQSESPELELGTAAEPDVGAGMAATLSLLRSQGVLESMTPEQRQRERAQRLYDVWKTKRLAEEAFREQERQLSKLQGSAKDQATREHENRKRELEEARHAEERFRDYRPDVDIKYHDQYGRELNHHEAWKLLSHTFHGKMPGRAKQEKYKRKVEEERKRERMAAGEASDMSKAFRERQARQGQAHMVLSVGVRGNAPQDFADALGPNFVQRNGGESANGPRNIGTGVQWSGSSKDKEKARDKDAGVASTAPGSASPAAMTSVPGLQSVPYQASGVEGSVSPSTGMPTAEDGPRMRPAFQPIASAAYVQSTADGAGGGGFKLSFGTKRKATEE